MAAKEIFAAGRSLFCPDRIYLATQHLASSDVLYGVLPAPLWDENQEEYCSALANPVSMYAISATSPDFDRAAAVMECMAMEAYYNTTPALFDSSFKARYSDGEEDAQMYDIIRDTIVFDPGRFYNPILNSVADRYRSSIANNVTQWASVVSSDFSPLPSLIDQLMKKLASY